MPGQQGTSQDQTVNPGIDYKLQTRTIAETLADIEECSWFWRLIENADLTYLLRRSGLHTLLAPRNQALDPSSADQVSGNAEDFLKRHLLAGGVESFDLRRCQTVKTLAQRILAVTIHDGNVRIGSAQIVRSDIACTNGVIHVIDRLLAG
ncbi:MAG: fasciclin domain-containing protein [Acidobacteriaceae bacterium]|nr:fasciclin domain-containing protein [Acidobacteriaceae bacterium]MBV9781670.1 fasciclin domain-containing protein [Acidobacteriaceae bacterium]